MMTVVDDLQTVVRGVECFFTPRLMFTDSQELCWLESKATIQSKYLGRLFSLVMLGRQHLLRHLHTCHKRYMFVGTHSHRTSYSLQTDICESIKRVAINKIPQILT